MKIKSGKIKLQTFYSMGMDQKLKGIYDQAYKEIVHLWGAGRKNFDASNLPQEFENLCDAYFLLKAGVIDCEYTDYHPMVEGDAFVFRVNTDLIKDR